ncbi:MAG: CPBP family intramembrane metalloprotease [Spirochaetaceae bacterium]|nr:CPBP family intramembrane metalloprotease [Spirochaetaceae bacterium]
MKKKVMSVIKGILRYIFDSSIFFYVLFTLYNVIPVKKNIDFETIALFLTECSLCVVCVKLFYKFKIPLKTVFFPKDTSIHLLFVLACASAGFVIEMLFYLTPNYDAFSSVMTYFQNHKIELSAAIFKSTMLSAVDIMGIFSAPILEEVIFRFFVYYFFKVHFRSIKKALVTTSLLFASLHILGDIIFGKVAFLILISAFIQRFLFSAIITACYEKTGNILSPIIIHMLWNTTIILLNKLIAPYHILMIAVLLVISLLVLTMWCMVLLWIHISRKKLVLYHETSTEPETLQEQFEEEKPSCSDIK